MLYIMYIPTLFNMKICNWKDNQLKYKLQREVILLSFVIILTF